MEREDQDRGFKNTNCLAFATGDVLEILGQAKTPGWWDVLRGDKHSWLLSSHVQCISQEEGLVLLASSVVNLNLSLDPCDFNSFRIYTEGKTRTRPPKSGARHGVQHTLSDSELGCITGHT